MYLGIDHEKHFLFIYFSLNLIANFLRTLTLDLDWLHILAPLLTSFMIAYKLLKLCACFPICKMEIKTIPILLGCDED